MEIKYFNANIQYISCELKLNKSSKKVFLSKNKQKIVKAE